MSGSERSCGTTQLTQLPGEQLGARLRAWARLALASVLLASGWGTATEVISTDHVRVIYDGAHLEPHARRAALLAEAALVRVAELFGSEPFPVTMTLSDTTDAFNAIASPIPRPTVALRFTPPLEETLGWSARSWLELLIIHELTHLAHFARTGGAGIGLGLVGEGVALPPPLWMVEGIATWIESELTTGGRRDDARTAGLLATLALSGDWPSLAQAGTSTHDGWPGGETRYLLGVGFLDRLVATHGWDAVVSVLRAYNRASLTQPFSDVWREVAGSDLYREWDDWRGEVERSARGRADTISAEPWLTDTGWYTGLPVLSPDGSRLAWRAWPSAIAVAHIAADAKGRPALENAVAYLEGTLVESLDWLDATTLIYTRLDRSAGTSYAEVYRFDLEAKREERLTSGGRAHFVRAAGEPGCFAFVQAAPGQPPAIVEGCGTGSQRVLFRAPPGFEIVGFDVSAEGRMVVSLWDRGFTGLAVLEPVESAFRPRLLTWDRYQDLDPAWTPEGAIRFRSDRTARFEIYEVHPDAVTGDTVQLTRLTDSVGGAFAPTSESVFVALNGHGFDLAWLAGDEDHGPSAARIQAMPGVEAPLEAAAPEAAASEAPAPEPYSPWSSLAPFGWLPTSATFGLDPFRLGLEAAVYGQDASVTYAYALTAGFDTALDGPLGPAYAHLQVDHGPTGSFASFVPTPPTSFSARLGVWPHAPHLAPVTETALGVQASATLRARTGSWAAAALFRVGMLHLQSRGGVAPDLRWDAALSTGGLDRWGYPTAGVRVDASGRWTPTATGSSTGAWATGTWRGEAFGAMWSTSLRTGWRQAPPVPLVLDDLAVTLGVESRWHVPTAWRYGDGRYSVERLTVTPAIRAWADPKRVGVGGDVTVAADLLVNYAAPVSVGVRVGWSQGLWTTWGVDFAF